MGLKSLLGKLFAKVVAKKIKAASRTAIANQNKVLQELIAGGANTSFGHKHNFSNIKTYEDFKANVPIHDYEDIKPYIEQMVKGEPDILWKGKPIYFAKTSGTTSGAKYIPISKESISNHINSARNALLCYIAETGNASFIDGKMIFLSGSPVLDTSDAIPTGRLSGISMHHVPDYLQRNRMPTWDTNCIEDWETKVDTICNETLKEDMTLISGIPSWVQMYFERLQEKTGGKKIKDIFPNFSLFVYGGVNYEPYRAKFESMIGKRIDSIELFPASEGFFAYQDSQTEKGMMLITDSGIFYEFIPADEFFNDNPTRLSLKDVEVGVNYALIVNNNAGLWGYSIGDTVKFVSKNPYRVIVSGRIKHYTSAFGEHVIAEEVEHALKVASEGEDIAVAEFSVAPQVNPQSGLPYHEWFIVFSKEPSDMDRFRLKIDKALQDKNIYYKDLIEGKILQPLVITSLKKDAFIELMKSRGKLGGQNKIPRLTNDREIADELSKYAL